MGSVVKSLLKFRVVLPAVWDPRRFLASDSQSKADYRTLDAETQSKLNMQVLTETIRSKRLVEMYTYIHLYIYIYISLL